MRALQILAGTTLLIAQISSGQITQLEQKETRTFHGTHSLSSGLKDLYKYAGKTNTVILDEGKKLTILDCYSRVGHPSWVSIDVKYGSSSERFNIYYGSLSSGVILPSPSPVGKTFIGPATIDLIFFGIDQAYLDKDYPIEETGYYSNGTTLWRYEVNNYILVNESTSSAYVSSTSVVVPSNAVGDVDVLLEQSNDMITWTQCLPGTYNASTQKRFFRVRAVEK
jgi:hypothetical protein